MDRLPRRHLNHITPEWIPFDSTFFITICTEPRGRNQLCHENVGHDVLKSIRHYHERQKWWCHLVLLMPDHIHCILSFPDIPSFALLVGDWKRWITTRHQIQWQENFFEHRLRREESLGQKADYILHNPVRAKLVTNWEDWPYLWISEGE